MDRCTIFVDAGHLLAEGGKLCCGTNSRADFTCDYEGLTTALAAFASEHCHLPVLRTYWYDGAPDAIPTPEHLRVAALPNVKLRLGRLVQGEQKGVDSLIVRDFMTLARERATATAYLLGGDEDLREGIAAAQEMGVRVVVLGIPTTQQGNQAASLIREADEHLVLETAFWSPHFFKVEAGLATPRPKPVQPVREGDQAIPPERRSSRGEMAMRLGEQFADAWTSRVTHDELLKLLDYAPRIPRELDVQLIVEAEQTLGSLRESQDLKKDLRAGFWRALKNARRTLKISVHDTSNPDP